jgi:hypothetical protein
VPDEGTSPIAHERSLLCSPRDAFAAYTGAIGEWWDPRYTANAETLQTVTIEPRVGGRVYAVHSDIGEHDWGEVSVWEPGRRLIHTFTLSQDPQHPSEVAVEFAPLEAPAAECGSLTAAGPTPTSRRGRNSGTGTSCSTGSPRWPARRIDLRRNDLELVQQSEVSLRER